MDKQLREIERLMQRGYDLAERNNEREASDVWLECWERIKERLPDAPFGLEAEGSLFAGLSQFLFNWITDIEMALGNAGRRNAEYRARHLRFCEEALARLRMPPHRMNFLRAHAETLWDMGRQEEAERAIQEIIDEDPDDVWSHVTWGDFYAMKKPRDLTKAEAIYSRALEQKGLREREVIQERLDMLAEMRGEPRLAPPPHEHGDRCDCGGTFREVGPAPMRQVSPPRTAVAVSTKVGRNERCPCGSGKKYKKCCGG